MKCEQERLRTRLLKGPGDASLHWGKKVGALALRTKYEFDSDLNTILTG